MQTKLTQTFIKELQPLPAFIKKRILQAVEDCRNAQSVVDIPHRKPLHTKKNRIHFRIRVGDYRVGVQVIDDILTFETIGLRGDFYKGYPPK